MGVIQGYPTNVYTYLHNPKNTTLQLHLNPLNFLCANRGYHPQRGRGGKQGSKSDPFGGHFGGQTDVRIWSSKLTPERGHFEGSS
jgi:hypothetical protein